MISCIKRSDFLKSPKALLLDTAFKPIQTISYKKAILLVFREKAVVVAQSEISIMILSNVLKIPLVLRLVSKIVTRGKKNSLIYATFSRDAVLRRDNFTCQHCGNKLKKAVEKAIKPKNIWLAPSELISLDHIHPVSKGGLTTWDNVVVCCFECNRKKGNKLLKDSGLNLLRKPFKPTVFDLLDPETKKLIASYGICVPVSDET